MLSVLVLFFRRLMHEPPVGAAESCFVNFKEAFDRLILHSFTVGCINRVFRGTMRKSSRQIQLVCLLALIFCVGVNVAAVKVKVASR